MPDHNSWLVCPVTGTRKLTPCDTALAARFPSDKSSRPPSAVSTAHISPLGCPRSLQIRRSPPDSASAHYSGCTQYDISKQTTLTDCLAPCPSSPGSKTSPLSLSADCRPAILWIYRSKILNNPTLTCTVEPNRLISLPLKLKPPRLVL
jgi:hypothetical protein